MERDVETFKRLLSEATADIAEQYFQLPTAGAQGAVLHVYRERVYAYELYHQLRRRCGELQGWPYSLGGEIDKRGHEVVRGPDLDNSKPDLLVHVPGDMGQNLCVIEIKSLPSGRQAIWDDVAKLTAYRERADYASAILLVFGNGLDQVREYVRQHEAQAKAIEIIDLFHHARPTEQGKFEPWEEPLEAHAE